MALQAKVANFIATCDLDEIDTDHLRETLASLLFRLRIMEIRCRLSLLSYEAEHATLRQELDKAIAGVRRLLMTATKARV